MPLRPRTFLEASPLRALFATAFWCATALAFFAYLDRFTLVLAAPIALALGLGLGVVALLVAEPLVRHARAEEVAARLERAPREGGGS